MDAATLGEAITAVERDGLFWLRMVNTDELDLAIEARETLQACGSRTRAAKTATARLEAIFRRAQIRIRLDLDPMAPTCLRLKEQELVDRLWLDDGTEVLLPFLREVADERVVCTCSLGVLDLLTDEQVDELEGLPRGRRDRELRRLSRHLHVRQSRRARPAPTSSPKRPVVIASPPPSVAAPVVIAPAEPTSAAVKRAAAVAPLDTPTAGRHGRIRPVDRGSDASRLISYVF